MLSRIHYGPRRGGSAEANVLARGSEPRDLPPWAEHHLRLYRRMGVDVMFTAKMPVARATQADLMQLATEAGPVPMQVSAVLVLGTGAGFSVELAR